MVFCMAFVDDELIFCQQTELLRWSIGRLNTSPELNFANDMNKA
jgi:hypothetical protein